MVLFRGLVSAIASFGVMMRAHIHYIKSIHHGLRAYVCLLQGHVGRQAGQQVENALACKSPGLGLTSPRNQLVALKPSFFKPCTFLYNPRNKAPAPLLPSPFYEPGIVRVTSKRRVKEPRNLETYKWVMS